jgi:hypothetical protein
MQITDNLSLTLELILVKFEEKKYKNRNFCNRWTLVTCRVDSNWTSKGLGDIKVNEISKKDQLKCTK